MQKRKTSLSDLKESVKRRKCNISRVQELGDSFIKALAQCLESDELDSTVPLLSDDVVELAMVSLLGLTGIEALRFAVHHVPDVFCNKRRNLVSKIMASCRCHGVFYPQGILSGG